MKKSIFIALLAFIPTLSFALTIHNFTNYVFSLKVKNVCLSDSLTRGKTKVIDKALLKLACDNELKNCQIYFHEEANCEPNKLAFKVHLVETGDIGRIEYTEMNTKPIATLWSKDTLRIKPNI